jgi:hypothetical protein
MISDFIENNSRQLAFSVQRVRGRIRAVCLPPEPLAPKAQLTAKLKAES